MRAILFLSPLSLFTESAIAHTLDGDAGFVEHVVHQLTGAHHLPALLIAVACLIAIARYRQRGDRRKPRL